MANVLGSTGLMMIIQRGLQLARIEHPRLAEISRTLFPATVPFGATVRVKTAAITTASDWVPDTALVAGDSAVTEVDVTINKSKKVGIHLTAFEMNQYVLKETGVSDDFARQLIWPVVDAVMADLIGQVTPDNVPSETVEALVDWDTNTFAKVGKKLTDRKVTKMGRFALISTAAGVVLRADPTIVKVNESGSNQTLREGIIGRINGFEVQEYTEVPSTNNLLGVAGAPDGLVLAGRVPDFMAPLGDDIPDPTLKRIIQDPVTGLAILMYGRTNLDAPGKQELFLLFQYGVGIGRAASLERIVSAATPVGP